MAELFDGYVLDTDEIINLARRMYRVSVFPTIHKNVDVLISQGLIVSSREVLNELRANPLPDEDLVLDWANTRESMFLELDEHQDVMLAQIMAENPKIVKISSNSGFDADPMLIALAMSKGWKIVTNEKRNGASGGKPHIPDVCDSYAVECINLIDLFEEKRWVN